MNILYYKIRVIDTQDNDRVLNEERAELGAPVLNYSGADDKYMALMTSELNFNFSVPGAADGAFFHLYSGNDTRYRVELHDQDDVLLWCGFLMPDQYNEPYKQVHFFVDMTATDGVGRLKGKTLDYSFYNGEYSVIKLISECLKQTGLSQQIYFAPAVIASNGYMWDEIAVDVSTYRDEKEPPLSAPNTRKKPKRKNAYDILNLLVENIGCTLFTWGGIWYIIGINRKHEESGTVQVYSANGDYIGTETLVRPVVSTINRFEATPPNIVVISPWKTVSVTWGIDEDGNLLPENAITESEDRIFIDTGNPFVDAANHGLPNEAPLVHWEKFGGIATGVSSDRGAGLRDWPDFSYVPIIVPLPPYNLSLGYVNPANGDGETHNGTFFRNIHLKKPKFVKTSDEYITRSLKVKVSVFSPGVPDVSAELEEGAIKDFFLFDVTVNNITRFSSRPGTSTHDVYQFDMDWRDGNAFEATPDPAVTKYTAPQLSGTFEKENIVVPENGYLNLSFFAPVSPDPENPLAVGYVFTALEFEYTAQDEWYDALTRDIDFTTEKDVEIYHGDSIQDLSKKQWRFRRPVPVPEDINEIPVFALQVEDLGVLGVFYKYFISYAKAQLIIQNPAFLTVTFDGDDYVVNDLYPNPDYAYQTYWNVVQDTVTGAWYVFLKKISDTGIWASASNFQNMFLDIELGDAYFGYVPENNMERESWRRYGKDENIRFGLALGRVYHDVQPEPIIKIDGTVFGVYNPLELFLFRWMEDKMFMPSRLSLRLSEGKTDVSLIESKINDVNDYIL